jgi:DNA-binding NtrC family response regulator
MEEERFRKALFHRLAVEVLYVPPLWDRKEDILLLANHFMRFFSDKMAKPLTGIEASAQKILAGYDYRENNVRELKNVMERAVLASDGRQIRVNDIVFSAELLSGPEVEKITPEPREILNKELIHINEERLVRMFEDLREKENVEKNRKPYYQVYEEMERKLILISLRQSKWKIKPAANLLGINHTNFRPKMMSMLAVYRERCGGDVQRVSREYKIPLGFLERRYNE